MNNAVRRPATEDYPRELVAGAAECVQRFGVRGFRLTDVAKAAGVSRGTVYNCFGDKETALNAGLAFICDAFIEGLATVVVPKTTLREQVCAAVSLIYEHMNTPQVFAPPLRTESVIAILLEHYGENLVYRWAGFWSPLVSAAQERGEVDGGMNPMHAGDWIVRVLLSLEILPSVVLGFDNADDMARHTADLLINGLAPR
ncbi:TetR family transcriptional regulator [Nocardia sp. SYP-A9097]|uniref:TetR/AcrR family transcriptional regulator n=1 Tax=Nocardia sp. SYP-A9097 TaxID=2663237 RepID=UPI00129B8BF6|nr:TetR/AcrR family transcriptional regulator [Nocardia sp. SYP-A9097]MRH86746.1 TetR family transcriptional regulator [Nocardia sp. SYP-A9097]